MGYMDKACCKGIYVAMIYSNEVAGKETDNLDSAALYFDLVYNQNDSSTPYILISFIIKMIHPARRAATWAKRQFLAWKTGKRHSAGG